MPMYPGYFGGAWMIIGWILILAFWGGIIALIVWAVRRATDRGPVEHRRSALDIAKERYARGEITKEQFEQLKKDLS